MIFGLFRRSTNQTIIDRLYLAVVEASRAPVLYADFGVPDTFEGRFESLTLHAVLVLRHLRQAAAPGPDMAQDLVDTIFKHFDRTLREMGVGDTVVPKRMKKMAEAFLGRSAAYDEAFRGDQALLRDTIARNVLNGTGDASALTTYVDASIAAINAAPVQDFIEGKPPFPDPATTVDLAKPSFINP